MAYMNCDTFTFLYYAYIVPVLDYYSSVWGFKSRKSSESVQNRAIRFYSGLGKSNTICGYQYDMKWLLPHNRWKVNKLRLWNKFVLMDRERLMYKVFMNEYMAKESSNWVNDVKNILCQTGLKKRRTID